MAAACHRNRYGVVAKYSLNKFSLSQESDLRVMRVAKKAVSWLPLRVDTWVGGYTRALEIDRVSLKRALTKTEKDRLVRALRKLGSVRVEVHDYCSRKWQAHDRKYQKKAKGTP